jgi:hypothetical protein
LDAHPILEERLMFLELLWASFLSLIPGLFWMWYLLSVDRVRRTHVGLLLLAFVAGAGAGWATLWSHDLLAPYAGRLDDRGGGPLQLLLFYVVWVGLFEEFWKMMAVRLTVYNLRSFREPLDGLIYGGASALGFASLENVIYIANHGAHVLLGRSILSTFGHVLGLRPGPEGLARRLLPARRPAGGPGRRGPGARPLRLASQPESAPAGAGTDLRDVVGLLGAGAPQPADLGLEDPRGSSRARVPGLPHARPPGGGLLHQLRPGPAPGPRGLLPQLPQGRGQRADGLRLRLPVGVALTDLVRRANVC